jgi:hypothetical protein
MVKINIPALKKSLIVGLVAGVIGFVITLNLFVALTIFLIWESVSYLFFYFKDVAKKQDEELEKHNKKIAIWVCTKCNSDVDEVDIKCKKCKSLLAVNGAVKRKIIKKDKKNKG